MKSEMYSLFCRLKADEMSIFNLSVNGDLALHHTRVETAQVLQNNNLSFYKMATVDLGLGLYHTCSIVP